ncbi:MAG: universal stress protein, partial [Pseudaminobacter sp.]
MQTSTQVHRPDLKPVRRPAGKPVIACVDRSGHAEKIVPHAVAVASALGSPLTLLQVLEAHPGNDRRPDPIEWDIKRHEARDGLKRLAGFCGEDNDRIEAELAEGQIVEEICRRLGNLAAGLLVLGTHGEGCGGERGLGSTARGVLEQATGPVLLVPVAGKRTQEASYRRILVPVDGSSWAESVLPLAQRLTAASGAELIVAHIVPVPELTETAPLEAEDIALRERLVERNERVARAYIERVRGRAAEKGLKVRAVIRRGDDVRTSLVDLIAGEGIDLVV